MTAAKARQRTIEGMRDRVDGLKKLLAAAKEEEDLNLVEAISEKLRQAEDKLFLMEQLSREA